jgi:3-hydroxyisobutyrate dehydrogenase-like beta-hydroxyacid dehydrogenase
VAKGVNQLSMALLNAALLESIAFGVNAGLDPATLAEALGGERGWRADVARVGMAIAEGRGNQIGVKFRELPYYLREAGEAGFPLPLTETLYAFCAAGERVVIDDNRPAPAFLEELTKREPSR